MGRPEEPSNPWLSAASDAPDEEGVETATKDTTRDDSPSSTQADDESTSVEVLTEVIDEQASEDEAHESLTGTARRFGRGTHDEEIPDEVEVTGPTQPQDGVTPLPRTLPADETLPSGVVYVVGTHGGSGATSMASLDDEWVDTEGQWPDGDTDRLPVILTARTHAHGLLSLRDALAQWAGHGAPGRVELLGVVLIEDAPGKRPKTLTDLEKVVTGGAPRVWRVGFIDSWRQGDPPRERRDRAVKKVQKQITKLAQEGATTQEGPR